MSCTAQGGCNPAVQLQLLLPAIVGAGLSGLYSAIYGLEFDMFAQLLTFDPHTTAAHADAFGNFGTFRRVPSNRFIIYDSKEKVLYCAPTQ